MRRFLPGLMICSSVLVSACGPKPRIEVQTKIVRTEIPAPLLEPVEVRARRVTGLQGVGEVLTDAVDAVTRANCQLSGIDAIDREARGAELRDWAKWCPAPVVTPES